MKPVTDPSLIAQLEGPQPVTDPAILAQLETPEPKKQVTRGDVWNIGARAFAEQMPFGATLGKYITGPAIGDPAGAARTVIDQSAQAGTLGFADELIDKATSKVVSKSLDIPESDVYNEAREMSEKQLAKEWEQQPGIALGTNLISGAGVGKALANTAAGQKYLQAAQKVGNNVGRGTALGPIVQDVISAAPAGLAAGAGTAKDGERLEGAGRGLLGSTLVSGAGSGINQAYGSLTRTKPAIPNSDEIRKQASGMYRAAEQSGGTLKPEFTDKFVEQVQKLKPQTEIGQIIGGDSPFTKTVEKISAIKGKPMTLEAAQELDELLGDAIDSFTDAGRLTKQGKKLLDIQSELRNMIDSADESLIVGGKDGFNSLKEGRKLWSQSRKLADVERIIQRAELMDNPATGIKTGFRTLLNNPNRLKGFTDAEKSAIKKAAESGVGTDLLRTFGSRLAPLIVGGAGGGLGATAAATAGSMASRNAATKLQVNNAQSLADLIASGGKETKPQLPPPLAQILLGK